MLTRRLASPRQRRTILRRVRYAAILLILAVYLFPIFWVFSTSLKSLVDAFSIPPKLLFVPTLMNYVDVLPQADFLRLTLNSLLAAAGNTVLALAIGSLAAWGISRHRIGGQWLLLGVLGMRLIPVITIVIPIFLVFVELRLIDTYLTLPLAYLLINLPFVIWIMKAFIDDIPQEIEESAILDGASTFSLLTRIVLPLALPGLIATSIFCFIFAWNELILAVVLTRVTAQTAMVGLTTLVSQDQAIGWGVISAASMIIMAPPILLAVSLRGYLLRGLTAGAMK
ncbi:MAG: carbohydrate ABC transporter permease [Chloroflexota bacterium]